jgi:hypothetical protein
MSEPDDLQSVLRDVYAECLEDYVGLWSIVRQVKAAYPRSTSAEVMSLTMQLLEKLISEKGVAAGDFAEDRTFRAWELPTPEMLEKVQLAWESVGRDPDIGEIAWFTVID